MSIRRTLYNTHITAKFAYFLTAFLTAIHQYIYDLTVKFVTFKTTDQRSIQYDGEHGRNKINRLKIPVVASSRTSSILVTRISPESIDIFIDNGTQPVTSSSSVLTSERLRKKFKIDS